MPPTNPSERIRARLIDALAEAPERGLTRTKLIRAATGDYKAGGAELDRLIEEGVVLTGPTLRLAERPAESQPQVETERPWDSGADRAVEKLAERVAGCEKALKQFGTQLAELAGVVGKLAEVVGELADPTPDEGYVGISGLMRHHGHRADSTPEVCSGSEQAVPEPEPKPVVVPADFWTAPEPEPLRVQAASVNLTPEGQTVLDRMAPEQRERALAHLAAYSSGVPSPDEMQASTAGFWE
ncbi:hypothetical protein PBI_DYLAN_11 [Mycobacterium phage Dylan]|uniref:Uncharacterized protein n=1 Tax=Mycobacterium phage Dylan TaxID=1340831 RepID=S5YLH0_9CAUD|nr:hypothetical protein PBI_DYLAN_11 [Mycobacterium phage Dylan]AGT20641.1 hypothetical protein PBI_DYLAN_11 [Mycobacterium phage Dylan]ALA48855.1 hypothetical protein ZAKHE101_12 [Mycobacterium phage Zakhe101]